LETDIIWKVGSIAILGAKPIFVITSVGDNRLDFSVGEGIVQPAPKPILPFKSTAKTVDNKDRNKKGTKSFFNIIPP